MKKLLLSHLKVQQDLKKAKKYSDYLSKLDSETTSDMQLLKLQSIWEDCIVDVPYYKELVDFGKAPERIYSWDDFYNIPILDRLTLKNNQDKFHRLSASPDIYMSTAGSTGEPVQLGQWRGESDCLRIAKLVPWVKLGYMASSSLYLIWGHSHLLGNGWRRYWNHSVRKLKDLLLNYHRVDAYSLDKIKAKCIAEDIIRKKPIGLIGYAAVLDLLCRYTEEYHNEIRRLGIKFVMSCAEPPPSKDSFDLFRSVFNCPILQEFGGVDFGHVGYKIDEYPYKLFFDLNILEAEPYGQNKTHNAVVTTLYRRYVPLIRYRQGDILTGVCHNDVGIVTSFENQIGRINDMVTLSDGNSIHSVALIHCFKDEKEIFNVQLILSDDGINFSLITREKLDVNTEERIRKKLEQISPLLKNAPFNHVVDMCTNKAGKRRWIVDNRTTKVKL
jgi:phenylacetate-coenzyme A ligase PaaK-like adenylate-forming protein